MRRDIETNICGRGGTKQVPDSCENQTEHKTCRRKQEENKNGKNRKNRVAVHEKRPFQIFMTMSQNFNCTKSKQ